MISMLLMETASICLYRNIFNDRAVKCLLELLKLLQSQKIRIERTIKEYCGIYSAILDERMPNFYEHVKRLTLLDENVFTLLCERQDNSMTETIVKQAVKDLNIIEKLSSLPCKLIKDKMKEKVKDNIEACKVIDSLPDWNNGGTETIIDWNEFIANRILWHQTNGAGLFAENVFFTWDGEKETLCPVKNPDPITLDKLYLLDAQKAVAIKNTKAFISGKPANNILFYGDRGTGKSSIVKALANEFADIGLRMIEVPKKYLDQMPVITKYLSGRGMKFIIFIDDLAFENNEEEYTALKAVLEGGIEHRPSNILLYATSNRRHLVKEKFSDRYGILSDNPDEEIHARDSIQEKLSLSDRFGITIVFSSPIKKEYLEIVHKIAEEENIYIEKSVLEEKAMQWQMSYNGMSPRTARQFITWFKANN